MNAGRCRTLIYHWPDPHVLDVSGLAAHTVHETVHHLADFERAWATALNSA